MMVPCFLIITLHTDASLVHVPSFGVVRFTLVNTLVVEREFWQNERGTLGTGTSLGWHQTVHLPPSEFWDRTMKNKNIREQCEETDKQQVV